MSISVDTAELLGILAATPSDQNVMLVGRHGIGKSEVIRQFYAERSMPVTSFFLGQMSDPGDLIGLLHKNVETGRSEFLPPKWWPDDDQPIVLFLDELNRGRPEILQSVMELTLSRTLAGKTLAAGSVVIAAVNDGDEYQLTDLDPALVSRFNVYRFEPSVDDWLAHAEKLGLDTRLLEFIGDSPHWLDGEQTVASEQRYDLSIEKTPDRRAWTRVAAIMNGATTIDDLTFKVIAGIVGAPATAALRSFLGSRLPISFAKLLDGDPQQRSIAASMSVQQIARLNEMMVRAIDKTPERIDAAVVHKYLQTLVESGKRESVAHFVSMTQQRKFAGVQNWVASSVALTVLIAEYLDSIAAPSS